MNGVFSIKMFYHNIMIAIWIKRYFDIIYACLLPFTLKKGFLNIYLMGKQMSIYHYENCQKHFLCKHASKCVLPFYISYMSQRLYDFQLDKLALSFH